MGKTLQDIREEKAKLESDIKELVTRFVEENNTVKVDVDISVHRAHLAVEIINTEVEVKVNILL